MQGDQAKLLVLLLYFSKVAPPVGVTRPSKRLGFPEWLKSVACLPPAGTKVAVPERMQTVIVMRLFIAWGRDEFEDRRADRAFAFMPGREA
jgi:hypothetical protein